MIPTSISSGDRGMSHTNALSTGPGEQYVFPHYGISRVGMVFESMVGTVPDECFPVIHPHTALMGIGLHREPF